MGGALQLAFLIVIFKAFLAKWRAGVWSRLFNRDTLVLIGAMMLTYLVGRMTVDCRTFLLVNILYFMPAGIVFGYDSAAAGVADGHACAVPCQDLPQ